MSKLARTTCQQSASSFRNKTKRKEDERRCRENSFDGEWRNSFT